MRISVWLCATLVLSCVETVNIEPSPDATADTSTDTTTSENIPWNSDAALDTMPVDATPDALTVDATPDALTVDATPDALAVDATPDALAVDATSDALSVDATPDAIAVDATPDAIAVDATPDALAMDVSIPDVGLDGTAPTCPILRGTHTWALWHIGPSTLIDLNDGTFFDARTCLRWEKSITSASTTYTAAEFSARCQSLGTGWRRPTRIEVESLVDYSRMSPAMWAFSVPYEKFWTSTTSANATAWTVLFYNGEVSLRSISSKYYGRCVTGNGDGELSADPPTGHYTAIGNTVEDSDTGLTWQKGDSQMLNPSPLIIATAESYCTTNGMRVPSIAELQTIVYDYHTSPAVDTTVFPSTASANYWTSTPYAGTGHLPWRINMVDGSTVLGVSADDTAFVKCVQ
jgi:hypothetical protein